MCLKQWQYFFPYDTKSLSVSSELVCIFTVVIEQWVRVNHCIVRTVPQIVE